VVGMFPWSTHFVLDSKQQVRPPAGSRCYYCILRSTVIAAMHWDYHCACGLQSARFRLQSSRQCIAVTSRSCPGLQSAIHSMESVTPKSAVHWIPVSNAFHAGAGLFPKTAHAVQDSKQHVRPLISGVQSAMHVIAQCGMHRNAICCTPVDLHLGYSVAERIATTCLPAWPLPQCAARVHATAIQHVDGTCSVTALMGSPSEPL
jgi:hypothetical protein